MYMRIPQRHSRA